MPYINVGDGVRLEGAHNCCFKVKSVGPAGVRPSRNAWLFFASVRCKAHDSKSETSCDVPLTKPPCRPTDALPGYRSSELAHLVVVFTDEDWQCQRPFSALRLACIFYVAWGGLHSHLTLWARTCTEAYRILWDVFCKACQLIDAGWKALQGGADEDAGVERYPHMRTLDPIGFREIAGFAASIRRASCETQPLQTETPVHGVDPSMKTINAFSTLTISKLVHVQKLESRRRPASATSVVLAVAPALWEEAWLIAEATTR